MAKKTARSKNGLNLAQEVDKLLTANAKIGIADVIQRIKAKEPKANEGSIKTSFYSNPKRNGTIGRKKRKKKVVRAQTGKQHGTTVNIDDLKAARKLVESVGDTEKAMAAVKLYGELMPPS